MKIAIAADHAGYEEKEQLKPLLDELGIQYEDQRKRLMERLLSRFQ